MTTAKIALAAALALGFISPALADRPGADWMTIEQATQKARDAGYAQVTEIEADDGRWEAKGVKNGQIYEFHIDPRTGSISNEHLDD
ncbi:PepSY domain-containing protein [Chenggangzhangella methanolivorans]|uniref:PepSY domain-containing protein n=1 Tax=Chenggangzhangella methanolivorans TaxID=1437009 RepID=A0A9E6RCT7_9HYPH|nr:PepSY domain-containing protein [Chenggangzhangella methanolivorans]QZO00939.1 PepSY domain-containing protein [Chenggangzhangella methanolivorans]